MLRAARAGERAARAPGEGRSGVNGLGGSGAGLTAPRCSRISGERLKLQHGNRRAAGAAEQRSHHCGFEIASASTKVETRLDEENKS